jgi:NhaP-type Na+/H+ or K+/H+ antiporter
MMALIIAASGGIAVGLAVGGLFGWFSREELKVHAVDNAKDVTIFNPYSPQRK